MSLALINTDRYPLHNIGAPRVRRWLEDLRAQLDDDGSCTLPGFVRADTLQAMRDQVLDIAHLAYPGPTKVTPYFFNYRLGEGEDLPPSHPLRRAGMRRLAQVAADLIPDEFLLRQLYQSQAMLDFLGAIQRRPVYRNADPYQSLNVAVMREGGCQQWHFDGGTMVTTLMLQEPEHGGDFEYAPMIRSDDDENFAAVEAVLDGERDRVRTLRLNAGTLSLFRGHYSLHRVTEVGGSRARLQAILGYTTQAGFVGSRESSVLHYGPRVAEIEARAPRYPA